MIRLMPLLPLLLSAPALAQAPAGADERDAIVCQLTGDCETPVAAGRARTSRTRGAAVKQVVAPQPEAIGQYDLRVLFDLDSATVSPLSRARIAGFATALRDPRLAGRRIRIEGHTDATGGAQYNLELSDRRARAVAALIEADGIGAERLLVQGFGSTRPLARGAAYDPANRRVIAVLDR